MERRKAYLVIPLLLLLAANTGVCAQNENDIRLVNHDTVYAYNCHYSNGTMVYDSYAGEGSTDAWAVLECNDASVILSVTFTQNSMVGGLRIWAGDTLTGALLMDNTSGSTSSILTSDSNLFTIHVWGDSTSVGNMHLSLAWIASATSTPCRKTLEDVRVTHVTENSAWLRWTTNSSYVMVDRGDYVIPVLADSLYLDGLEPNTSYTVSVTAHEDLGTPCCTSEITFLTEPVAHVGCPDVTDLRADYVRCLYGSFYNPYTFIGVVDNHASDMFNRHTVHTDTTETDPMTGGGLRTVCPGTSASVRLGNYGTQSQAEAISYRLYIDTNLYALLLLRYAVVLQNPDHQPSQQPRFTLEILDDDNNVIDPVCGKADFEASGSLGWNENGPGLLWKDWTTVGFDLTPYHGQTVKVRFTTRDCSEGAHFGYAYFSAECMLNSATTEYCGATDSNTITAPDGFNYLWYYTSPQDTVATTQTVHFTNNDELLHCRLTSKENPSCYVTLNTYAGHRWPLAIADTLFGQQEGCDGYRLYFLNRSTITTDAGDTTGEHCEAAMWYFGDGFFSSEYSPQHLYHAAGNYNVTMVASIANNSCRDTTHLTVHVPDFYVMAGKDSVVCDSAWVDGHYVFTDTLGTPWRAHHDDDCDTVYRPYIRISHSPETVLAVDTFCYSEVYSWRGLAAGTDTISRPTAWRLVDRIPVEGQCDSLVVLPLIQLPRDAASIERTSDCPTRTHRLVAHTGLPDPVWSSEPEDPTLVGHEYDSIIYVSPTNTTVYLLTNAARDTAVCPAMVGVTLNPVAFPEARLKVNPDALTYESTDIDAYDHSLNATSRQWLLVRFPDGSDTLRPATTLGHLHYRVDDIMELDSLQVTLVASNSNCADTALQSLPCVRGLLWVPNAFTPAEEINNRFVLSTVGISEATLTVYDRRGRAVFSTTDLAAGWDGTRDGRPCPQGAYTWHLRYQSAEHPGVYRTASGTVTLVR